MSMIEQGNSPDFTNLGLSPTILRQLQQQQITQPSLVQETAIPAILKGKDVIGIAPTGSGKTLSYALPLLMKIGQVTNDRNWSAESTKARHPLALVIVPTRELAMQVAEVFMTYADHKSTIRAVFGGVSINPQMLALNPVKILIATPGRLIELIESNAVHLSLVKTLVLDEADKLLNEGFKVELDILLNHLPLFRQNLLFSATLSEKVSEIQRVLLVEPLVIKIERPEVDLDQILQSAYSTTDERKGPLLRYLIQKLEMKQVLVFTSSVYKADNVADKLRKNGIDASAIHSKKSQGARTDALTRFKSGKLQVLVATDLMARGIDVPTLPFVINYELPRSPKDYIHRIGRTGRASASGQAISLIAPTEEHHFKVIQKKMGRKVAVTPSDELNLF